MKREERLRTSADFQQVRDRAPRAWQNPLLVLYAAPNDVHHTRLGITVSSRVGKATGRNRVRRRIRESLRQRARTVGGGIDLLFIARPASAHATWEQLQNAVADVMGRAGLSVDGTPTDDATELETAVTAAGRGEVRG